MLSVPAATDCAPAYGDLDDPWPVFRGILAEHRDWLRSFIAEQTALLAERDPDALTLVFDSNSTEYLEDDRVDLSAWAHDAIALALPDKILCRPDCAGLCPVCGKDLNVEPHEHVEERTDPRWAVLNQLREE